MKYATILTSLAVPSAGLSGTKCIGVIDPDGPEENVTTLK